jgi:DNA-binding MarR family transcriptional regulator
MERPAPIRVGAGFAALAPGADPLPVEVVLNLLRVNALISRIVQPLFNKYGLDPTGYGVLEVLINADEPLTPSVISRRILLAPQTMSHQLNALEKRGFITRIRHASDRRSVLVQLNDAGRALVVAVTRELIPLDVAMLAPVDRADQDRLVEILGSVQTACDDLLGRPADGG